MNSHFLVLDSNILIRAVLGTKVRNILLEYHHIVDFFTPDICIHDAEKYLPILFKKREMRDEFAFRSTFRP